MTFENRTGKDGKILELQEQRAVAGPSPECRRRRLKYQVNQDTEGSMERAAHQHD